MAKNDDIKRLHEVKVSLTEREYLGLCKLAGIEDRKASDMARVLLRRGMFGTLSTVPCDCNDSDGEQQS